MRDRSEEDNMVLAIYAKTIVRTIIIAVLLITLAGLAARFILYMWGEVEFLQPLRIFDVGEERSIPTWFESIQFLLCSMLLAVIAVAKKQRNDRYSLHWGVLSIILLLLSLDKLASINREIGKHLNPFCNYLPALTQTAVIFSFWWVPVPIFEVIV